MAIDACYFACSIIIRTPKRQFNAWASELAQLHREIALDEFVMFGHVYSAWVQTTAATQLRGYSDSDYTAFLQILLSDSHSNMGTCNITFARPSISTQVRFHICTQIPI